MKKNLSYILILACLIPTMGYSRTYTEDGNSTITCPIIHTCFTPFQDCTHRITAQILQAKNSVLVQAYYLTSKPIADALVQAKKKGVSVKVILDKSQRKNKYSLIHYLAGKGIPIWIDTKPAIAHNKIMIIDGNEVITGSFNFTASAQERNAENLVFILDKKLAQEYTENWEMRERMSTPYKEVA